jgi:hypothetical protein
MIRVKRWARMSGGGGIIANETRTQWREKVKALDLREP